MYVGGKNELVSYDASAKPIKGKRDLEREPSILAVMDQHA
jgi:hypothetical protein